MALLNYWKKIYRWFTETQDQEFYDQMRKENEERDKTIENEPPRLRNTRREAVEMDDEGNMMESRHRHRINGPFASRPSAYGYAIPSSEEMSCNAIEHQRQDSAVMDSGNNGGCRPFAMPTYNVVSPPSGEVSCNARCQMLNDNNEEESKIMNGWSQQINSSNDSGNGVNYEAANEQIHLLAHNASYIDLTYNNSAFSCIIKKKEPSAPLSLKFNKINGTFSS